MKKFKFSLEKVLEIKEIEEKILQKKLLEIQYKIFDNEKKIADSKDRIVAERSKICDLSQNIISSKDIMLRQIYIENHDKNIDYLEECLETLRIEEDEARKKLIEKSREKKDLERLKEIKQEDYRKEYNKQQQLFIDDMSIQNHRFKTGNAV
jgi:flagellar FliJ protein